MAAARNAGHGSITRPGELQSRTRTGKSVVSLPKGRAPLIPCPIYDLDSDWICCVHSNGNLLVFPASEVPEMARGKGSRLIGITARSLQVKRNAWWSSPPCRQMENWWSMLGIGIRGCGGKSWSITSVREGSEACACRGGFRNVDDVRVEM